MSEAAKPKKINLALQGGGALGAFSWGVIDRMLEDERIEIAAVSGASAGAMNAVVLAAGLAKGGREAAREELRRFWREVAESASLAQSGPLLALFGSLTPPWLSNALSAPVSMLVDLMSRVASPYEFNPLNLNPLKSLLEGFVDFEAVRRCEDVRVFVAATNVETGRVRVFQGYELTIDHVMASACLPLMFQAVEIDGTPYWDGGYMGNPALFPLFDTPDTQDIMIVQINPIERVGAPKTAPEIIARINEITFNASLLRELRAIEFVTRLLDKGRVEEEHYKRMLVHVVHDDTLMLDLDHSAAMRVEWGFFEELFTLGRTRCAQWLAEHFDDLGVRATVDLRGMFEGEIGPMGERKPKPKGPTPGAGLAPPSSGARKDARVAPDDR